MSHSTVNWLGGGDRGHRCGYCKNPHGSCSDGLWAYSLTPLHYQLMINRGWRRSGQYCYHPRYRDSCCQLYTIRCLVDDFILTTSMRHTIKKMTDFLVFDKRPSASSNIKFKISSFSVEPTVDNGVWRVEPWIDKSTGFLERLLSSASSEWFNTANSLSVFLVKSWPPSRFFLATVREEHLIYTAYQCHVHSDPPSKVDMKQFAGFLVETPFEDGENHASASPPFGAYHLQFRINNRLAAVSVIDILPHCVSSVYCFYDPAFTFLNLGTYTALYEIALARILHSGIIFPNEFSTLAYNYMGFYINNCRKMKYKGQYRPAQLLCPESMRWQPIEDSLHVIERANNAYTRLDPNEQAVDEDGDAAARLVSHSVRSSASSSRKNSGLSLTAARLLGSVCSREFEFVN